MIQPVTGTNSDAMGEITINVHHIWLGSWREGIIGILRSIAHLSAHGEFTGTVMKVGKIPRHEHKYATEGPAGKPSCSALNFFLAYLSTRCVVEKNANEHEARARGKIVHCPVLVSFVFQFYRDCGRRKDKNGRKFPK